MVQIDPIAPHLDQEYATFKIVSMGTSKNWGKYSRRQQMSDAASRPLSGPKQKDIFIALAYYADNSERKAGNWVVLPGDLEQLNEEQKKKFLTTHRNKQCAISELNFSQQNGDRIFRVSNEVVEMLTLKSCDKCRFN